MEIRETSSDSSGEKLSTIERTTRKTVESLFMDALATAELHETRRLNRYSLINANSTNFARSIVSHAHELSIVSRRKDQLSWELTQVQQRPSFF
jgi:hypothetical protein